MLDRLGYDPDSGHLFRWDGKFHYEGKVTACPSGALIAKDSSRCRAVGALFLSGIHDVAVCLDVTGSIINFWVARYGCMELNLLSLDPVKEVLSVPTGISIVICGLICSQPDRLRNLCHAYPAHWLRPVQLIEGLAAFGVLAETLVKEGQEQPRQVQLMSPCRDDIEGAEFQEFDPKLEGDGVGRMANLVAKGQPVLNQMWAGPCLTGFYGSIISREGNGVWMTTVEQAAKMFPVEPPSIKKHVARYVPVQVKATDAFREQTDCEDERVNLLVASGVIPDSTTFLRMFFPYCGKKIVCLLDPKSSEAPKNLPVYRYNKGWRMDAFRYKEVADGPSGVLRSEWDGRRSAIEEPQGNPLGDAS